MSKDTQIASALLRLLSALIDLMVWMMFFLFVLMMVSSSGDLISLMDSLLYGLIIYIVISSFGAAAVNSFMTSRFGGTFGKLLTGTRVVGEESGKYLSFKKAFLRNPIGYAVSSLMLGLGFIWILVDEKRQAWHDMLVGSLVIMRSRKAYFIAAVSIFLLVGVNVFLVRNVYAGFLENRELYEGFYEEVRIEIDKLLDEEFYPTDTNFEPQDLGNYSN